MTLRAFLAVAAAIAALQAWGQNTSDFVQRLRLPDPTTGRTATVTEHGSAQTAVREMSARRSQDSVAGYRVRIFLDNAQNARTASEEVATSFREQFPDVRVTRDYAEPYYRVTVGSCLTQEEALVLWGRVKGRFEKAFIVADKIRLSELYETGQPQATEDEEETADSEKIADDDNVFNN